MYCVRGNYLSLTWQRVDTRDGVGRVGGFNKGYWGPFLWCPLRAGGLSVCKVTPILLIVQLEHHGWVSVKCELLQSSQLAPMCLPDITVHDQTCQAFLFYICMLQVIKNWRGWGLGIRLGYLQAYENFEIGCALFGMIVTMHDNKQSAEKFFYEPDQY